MSYMEAPEEMPWENNSQVPIPRAQRVAVRVHLRLAFLPVWDSNLQDAEREVSTPYHWATRGGLNLLVNPDLKMQVAGPAELFNGRLMVELLITTLNSWKISY